MEYEEMKTLRDIIDYGAEKFGERSFMEFKTSHGVASKSYAGFREEVLSFARVLDDWGMTGTGAHVAVIGPTCVEWCVAFLGSSCASCAAIPLAPKETDEMNCRLMDFADVDVLVYDKAHASLFEAAKKTLPRIKRFISLDDSSSQPDVFNISDLITLHLDDCEEYTHRPKRGEMAAIFFTSGTTGFPKGVMLSHLNLTTAAVGRKIAFNTPRLFCCMPLHHCFCFSSIVLKGISLGRTLCVNDKIENIVADLQMYRPQLVTAVPAIIKTLFNGAFRFADAHPELERGAAVKKFFGGELDQFISGGAPLAPELNELYNETGVCVYNGYGMTECAPIIANNTTGIYTPGSVGKPLPQVRVRIDDGEVLVKGDNVMLGYYKNPEATREAFTDDGWFKTGDLGRFDDNGFLYLTGRKKNLILLDNGENVSAEMLEAKFENEPIVREVVCYGENNVICAEIYPNKKYLEENGVEDIDGEMIRLLMRVNSGLANFQRIARYVIRDIPFERTTSGKIRRDSAGHNGKREVVEPSTPTEKRVCVTVRQVLGLRQVSMADNFFEIGGDSLSAAELAASLNIKTQTVYDKPFLAALAASIDGVSGKYDDNGENVNAILKKELSHVVHTAKPSVILLTGATGFLGIHILKELLGRHVKVNCLVRDRNKLTELAEFYFGGLDLSDVEIYEGDIERARFGLSDKNYAKLCGTVDTVIHTAANVHHAGDYNDIRRTNVYGTENVIGFCKQANAVLHHTSTVSVHGGGTVLETRRNASFDENVLDIGQRFRDNVYIHSKYRAEESVIRAMRDGLLANIYRIGNLTWRSSDGRFQRNEADNGFLSRVKAVLKLGVTSRDLDKYPMDFTQVDECARAYVGLVFSGRANRVYHLFNPNMIDRAEMFRRVGVPYREVSSAEMISLASANSADRDVRVLLFYIITAAKSDNIDMRCEQTVAALAERGFKWSQPDGEYLRLSDSPSRPQGHCLDFAPLNTAPIRETAGKLTPVQQTMLGQLAASAPCESVLFEDLSPMEQLYGFIVGRGIKKPLFITYENARADKHINKFIGKFGDCPVFDSFKGEPDRSTLEAALLIYADNRCDSVIAVGGGSVLDVSKMTALKAANPGKSLDDICRLDTTAQRCVPFFVLPTTAGTGSESTVFAVITDKDADNIVPPGVDPATYDPSKAKKKPYLCDRFYPDAVALDARLTRSLGAFMTSTCAIDALAHATESYISLYADTFPDERDLAPEAAKLIFRSLKKAVDEPADLDARTDLLKGSFLAGRAFGRIGTGYIHAIAHRLGELYHKPHGACIARTFVPVLRETLPCAAARLAELAKAIGAAEDGADDLAAANAYIDAVERLISETGLDLFEIAVDPADIREIMLRAQDEAKSMGCPRAFTDEHVADIIAKL